MGKVSIAARSRQPRARLVVEWLEDRSLPSVMSVAVAQPLTPALAPATEEPANESVSAAEGSALASPAHDDPSVAGRDDHSAPAPAPQRQPAESADTLNAQHNSAAPSPRKPMDADPVRPVIRPDAEPVPIDDADDGPAVAPKPRADAQPTDRVAPAPADAADPHGHAATDNIRQGASHEGIPAAPPGVQDVGNATTIEPSGRVAAARAEVDVAILAAHSQFADDQPSLNADITAARADWSAEVAGLTTGSPTVDVSAWDAALAAFLDSLKNLGQSLHASGAMGWPLWLVAATLAMGACEVGRRQVRRPSPNRPAQESNPLRWTLGLPNV
ncbi:MAG: hypothetical protein L0Y71_18340 [Gemmataceae bacterium]|nr:hypothetical protein [Gemmataceae bacterium]